MKEFIEELKYNQNVNIEKGLENRINIDYVIERLERINNTIYDNGALMLGRIDSVIKRVKKEIEENLDMVFVDQEELLKDLEDLKSSDNDIVCINYDNGMYYTIDYWNNNNDRVEENE